jgi:uracil-DNA glycosylase family 4
MPTTSPNCRTSPVPETAPAVDCGRCPRLVALRRDLREEFPAWHNAPVPSFGGTDARLLVAGLAPGRNGANRTGRPFTGDAAGNVLYPTLKEFGFASGMYEERRDDGLKLIDCRITNAVRCVPPGNKPVGAEIAACRGFLAAEIAGLARLEMILALGRIAHDSVVTALGQKPAQVPFTHGALHRIDGIAVADSYHCSRYNLNTRRLTPEMFTAVVARVRECMDTPTAHRTALGKLT